MIIRVDKLIWIIFLVVLLGLLMFVKSGAHDKAAFGVAAYLERN